MHREKDQISKYGVRCLAIPTASWTTLSRVFGNVQRRMLSESKSLGYGGDTNM
jgi:hypothetical protein